jgi:GAF domain-containing protein
VGVLSLYSREPEGFNDDRGRLIQMIAPHLATAISAAVRNATAKGAPVAAEKAQAAVPLRRVSAR